jgi:adenylate kinase
MIIVLLGPPGAGKGTQGERLAIEMGIPKIATGDVLRAAVRDGTPRGLEAKAIMDRGDLVPDAVILAILGEALGAPAAAKGAILDGAVRTVPQAAGLNAELSTLGKQVNHVLLFDIAEEELVRRLSGRTTCEKCQRAFTGRTPGDACGQTDCPGGGLLLRRKDDEPEAIRKRLVEYHEKTAPVVQWYREQGANVHVIDAVGALDDVLERVHVALAS